jgi:hypothetical protein
VANVDFGYIITQDETIVPNVMEAGFSSGLTIIDASGALTPEVVPVDIALGIYLVAKDGATLAQYRDACGAFAAKLGYAGRGQSGGRVAQTVIPEVAPAQTALDDGTWTPAA